MNAGRSAFASEASCREAQLERVVGRQGSDRFLRSAGDSEEKEVLRRNPLRAGEAEINCCCLY